MMQCPDCNGDLSEELSDHGVVGNIHYWGTSYECDKCGYRECELDEEIIDDY